MPQHIRRTSLAVATRSLARTIAIVTAVIACGGTDQGSAPSDATTPTDTPTANPVAIGAHVQAQSSVVGDAFAYDATLSGTAFTDPRATGLTYVVTFAPSANGFAASGGRIIGAPLTIGTTTATITATDAIGSHATQSFTIVTLTNAPVAVLAACGPQSAVVGAAFNFDATEGGATFSDPRATGLTYSVAFTPATNTLSATNGRINGTLASAGIVTAAITATDATGRSATTSFAIIAFSSDLSAPVLPATPFAYADASVPVPPHFAVNGAGGVATAADNMPASNVTTNAGATLGRVLFYDRRMSANDRVACASCHQQQFAFGDTAKKSRGFAGGFTGRHSTGLANARYYQRGRFFWDERAATLEAQVLMPIQDATEMGMTLPNLAAKLTATSYYPALFQSAFGTPDITSDRISRALAQFVRSLVSSGSKFDQAFAGGTVPNFGAVFTPEEIQGQQLFNGGAVNCARCHGTNAHISDDIHNTGLDAISTDNGAGAGQFKAPSLRNIAVRAPYMHDGRFNTLDDVVEFYNSGVQANANLDQRLRAPGGGPPVRLNLSAAQKASLVAYLRTLTDNAFIASPKLANPFPQ